MAVVETTTLYQIPAGRSAVIQQSSADPRLNRRLRELGLRTGAQVHVVQKTAGGGRMVKVRNTVYALDSYALKHITVSPEGEVGK